jgi:hypothetical protein
MGNLINIGRVYLPAACRSFPVLALSLMLLAKETTIYTGYQVSTQPLDDYQPVEQPLAYFQLSDFTDDGQRVAPEAKIYLEQAPPAALHRQLVPGQVLLAAKGARLLAACVQPEWLPALASPSFFVLSVNDSDHLLPEFLTLVLNLPDTREALRARLSTTTIPTLNRRDLLDLELLASPHAAAPTGPPPIQQQQQAIALHNLWLQEKALTIRYLQAREQVIYTAITTSITQ